MGVYKPTNLTRGGQTLCGWLALSTGPRRETPLSGPLTKSEQGEMEPGHFRRKKQALAGS